MTTKQDREAAVRLRFGFIPGGYAAWIETGDGDGGDAGDTADELATARAEGYARGVEDAARVCDRVAMSESRHAPTLADDCADTIRALAEGGPR